MPPKLVQQQMEVAQIAQLLSETLSPDSNVVRASSEALERLSLLPDFPFSLLSIVAGTNPRADLTIYPFIAIVFSLILKSAWNTNLLLFYIFPCNFIQLFLCLLWKLKPKTWNLKEFGIKKDFVYIFLFPPFLSSQTHSKFLVDQYHGELVDIRSKRIDSYSLLLNCA